MVSLAVFLALMQVLQVISACISPPPTVLRSAFSPFSLCVTPHAAPVVCLSLPDPP